MRATLLYVQNGEVRRLDDLGAIEAALDAGVHPFWLDLQSPRQEDVDWLARRFRFHPLVLDDVLSRQMRPKFEAYEGFVFLVSHSIQIEESGTSAYEIESFLGQDYLITTHEGPSAILDGLLSAKANGGAALHRGPDHVLYLILDDVAETYFDAIDYLDDRIDDLEMLVVTSTEPHVLDRIFSLRRTLATMRRYVSPLRDAVNSLLTHEDGYVRQANAAYLRDVHSLLLTIHEMVESQRDLTSGVLDAYLSSTSNRLNEIMKRLTIVASIFLPISFVASFFGTNFAFLPFEDAFWFWVFLAALAIAPVGMLYWFRRLGWL